MRRFCALAALAATVIPCLAERAEPPSLRARPDLTSARVQSESEGLIAQRDRLVDSDRFKEALPLAIKIAELCTQRKSNPAELGLALNALGKIESELRLFVEADKDLSESLKLLTEKGHPPQKPIVAVLCNEGRSAYLQNKFDLAESLLNQAESLEHKIEPGSSEEANLLADLGTLLNERGRTNEAKSIYLRVLAIFEKVEPNSLGVARTLTGLGTVEVDLGNLDQAKSLLERSLRIHEKLAPMSIQCAYCLTDLGSVAVRRLQLSEGTEFFGRALAIIERAAPESLSEAKLLANMGWVAQLRGHIAEAESLTKRALALNRKISPKGVGEAQALYNLGSIAYIKGNLESAQTNWEQSETINERLAPGSMRVADALSKLGVIATKRGQLDQAQAFEERALAIQERGGPNTEDLTVTLDNLGSVAFKRGRLAEARRFYERSLKIQERRAPQSLLTAQLLVNLNSVSQVLGFVDQAQSYLERAASIQHKLGPDSITEATILQGLGGVALAVGRLDEARAYFERALKIFTKDGSDSLNGAGCLENLGAVSEAQGNLDAAQKFFSSSVLVRERVAPKSLEGAITVLDLGHLAARQGNWPEAERQFSEGALTLSTIAPGSLYSAVVQSDLGVVAENLGNLEKAQRLEEGALLLKQQLVPGSLELMVTLNNLTDIAWRRGREPAEAMYLRKRCELACGVATREGADGSNLPVLDAETSRIFSDLGRFSDSSIGSSFYEAVLRLRGMGLALESRAKKVGRYETRSLALRDALARRYSAVKAESDWIQSRTSKISDAKYGAQLVELRSQTEAAQAAVVRALKSIDRRLASPPSVRLTRVQSSVPIGSTLVEFVRVGHWDAKSKKQTGDDYAAFILTRKDKPRLVQLGSAAPIDSDVKRFGELLNGSAAELRHLSRELFNFLIKPLGEMPRNLLITPDSVLNGLPFNALIDNRGRYLIESKSISVLGGGRDLVEPIEKGNSGPSAVIAAPLYETDVTKQALTVKHLDTEVDLNASPLRRDKAGKFEPLPGASREGELVGRALGVNPIIGADATEDKLYAIKHPRVLHIATHAVFYPPLRDPRTAQLALEFSDSFASRLQVADDPMLRSALVFAGANEADALRKKGLNDGWATALEISQMDLTGTELVVLSGCDTGLGFFRAGEGVFGLQRAFRFAGAQTLIMSLCSVPDQATQKLMANFYKHWKPGMPAGSKLRALRRAQLALLHNPKTRDPRNWAGFVLMGNR